MTKTKYYVYLGTNGVIESPVFLEDIYFTTRYQLVADNGHKLTKDGKTFVSCTSGVAEDEVDEWKEVPIGQIKS